ncbi:hypothetical protein PNEG_04265 [Pneumocystis murina B123]|uniref:Uncharacterized protein n=1 Tax=Pneumocystis murina (strain B123) TaxID=1069680 RepID=A0A0W4ZX28_PNEMU|nr:hypothetical protein PNEG_04265 [Pneumocystis murina B123]KTW32928.1 hypothetical protein PNEG_04265 [Pneumocystis murina B123]
MGKQKNSKKKYDPITKLLYWLLANQPADLPFILCKLIIIANSNNEYFKVHPLVLRILEKFRLIKFYHQILSIL